MVTACSVFQFEGVNVTVAGATVPSVVSAETMSMTTFAVGSLASTMVKFVALPASTTLNPKGGLTMIPAVSSSTFETEMSVGFLALYNGSSLTAAAVIIV